MQLRSHATVGKLTLVDVARVGLLPRLGALLLLTSGGGGLLASFLLLGRSSGITAGVLEGEALESSNISALLDENGNGLDKRQKARLVAGSLHSTAGLVSPPSTSL